MGNNYRWVGPRFNLDDVERRMFCPYLESNSDLSVFQLTALYLLSRTEVISLRAELSAWVSKAADYVAL
jgi:hypothetical protein